MFNTPPPLEKAPRKTKYHHSPKKMETFLDPSKHSRETNSKMWSTFTTAKLIELPKKGTSKGGVLPKGRWNPAE